MKSGEAGLEQWLAKVRSEYWERLSALEAEQETPGRALVVFQLAGRQLAVEAALCKGVVRRPRVTRLPAMPPHVLGVAGIRGEVVSVTDPALFLGVPGERATERGFLLVVAAEEVKTALWVDRVTDLVTFAEQEILPLDSPWPGAPEGLITGQVSHGGGHVFLLDGRRYVEGTGVKGSSR